MPNHPRYTSVNGREDMSFNIVHGGEFYTTLFKFLKVLPSDYIGTLTKIQHHHGDLVHWRVLGGLFNFAFISDPFANRELFVRNNDALKKSSSQIQTFLYAAGNSVATAHGSEWRTKRREANNLFSRSIVEASCAGQVDVVRNYVETLSRSKQDAIVVARRMAALTSSRGILGQEISLAEADTQIEFSKAATDRFNAESSHLFARPNWVLAPWRRVLTQHKKRVFPIVQKAINELRESDAPNDGLMNHYVKGDFVTSSNQEMLTILVGLLMGAQDNVAAATGWGMAFLAQRQSLQIEIRNELKGIRGEAQDLDKCRLLRATILEVFRLRPPAPANQPRILQWPVKVANHILPKGTFVFNSIFNMHHDARVFDEPQKFDPTRFLVEEIVRHPSFAPFGHGSRNCVAQRMAMQQVVAIVAAILHKHQLTMPQVELPDIIQMPFVTPAPFEINFERVNAT